MILGDLMSKKITSTDYEDFKLYPESKSDMLLERKRQGVIWMCA
jgi:hypothetical protein